MMPSVSMKWNDAQVFKSEHLPPTITGADGKQYPAARLARDAAVFVPNGTSNAIRHARAYARAHAHQQDGVMVGCLPARSES